MSTAPTTNNSQPITTAGPKSLLPPEEQFWQRYSPHHEFALSSIGSVTIHVVIAVLIVAGITLHLFDASEEPLAVGAVEWEELPGGGGGDPSGVEAGLGKTLPDKVGDITKLQDPVVKDLPSLTLPKPKLDQDQLADIIPQENTDDGAVVDYTEAVARLANVEKQTQDKLLRSLGKGGSGSGGGKGGGVGTGIGDGKGPGTGSKNLSERQKRVLRWNMVFDTRNGEDYRLQLQSLGAILAIPTGQVNAKGEHQYAVIRDLRAPARPIPEDLRKIKRIFWVDNRSQSVHNLAQALGLRSIPAFVVAFFPVPLEQKLAQLEARFARLNGRSQNITETRFRILLNGRTGKYEPTVIDQR